MIGVSDAQPGSAFDFIRQVNTTAPASGSCDPCDARRGAVPSAWTSLLKLCRWR